MNSQERACVMRDCEMKRHMTNTGLEKLRPNNEEELPVVLLHGTSGQSEDWSRVVEHLAKHRSVIRPNYFERITGSGPANGLAISDFAARGVAAANADGRRRFDLVGYSLGAAVATFVAAEYSGMGRFLGLGYGVRYGGESRV